MCDRSDVAVALRYDVFSGKFSHATLGTPKGT